MIRFVVLVCALVASTAASPFTPRATVIQNAKLGQFPYQISLRAFGGHYCGGTILNNRWILTAADCVDYWPISSYQIAVGSIHRNGPFSHLYNLTEIIIHKDYDEYNINNNIALLRVDEDIEFTSNVQPADLETEDIGGDVGVNVTAWARTEYPEVPPDVLRWVTIPTLTVEDCQEQHYAAIYPTHLCTLTTCQDDTGSPVVRAGRVVGVMSWTMPCERLFPDVYTRVSSYADWIREIINN